MLTALAITGSNFATAVIYAAPVLYFIGAGVLLWLLVEGIWKDRQCSRPESDPEKIAATRAEMRAQVIASLPESWDNHLDIRADIAKTRTAMTHRRMTEDAWKKATGGDAA